MSKSKVSKKILILAVFICSFFCAAKAFSQAERVETIKLFRSDIEINLDGSMLVKETIVVNSTGGQIKHGIYRDFPTRYKDKLNNNYVVDFELLSVVRDGALEPHHFKSLSNGMRIYIGSKDRLLDAGERTYILAYKTNRQIGFFKGYDQLYWNVTGNGWAFPIEKAEARITLPNGNFNYYEAYTGYQNAKGQDYKADMDYFDRSVFFSTTRSLKSQEGLTIVLNWPKGIIPEPDLEKKLAYLLKDNLQLLIALIGLIVVLGYYLAVWHLFGRDPQKGIIFPLYAPPDKLSPAAVRYIIKMKFDNKVFAACLISMAVKGFLKIINKSNSYILDTVEKDKEQLLSEEEKSTARALFKDYQRNSLKLIPENHEIINNAKAVLKNSLRKNFEANYFFSNFKYFVPGVLLTVLVLISSMFFLRGEKIFIGIFMGFWLTGWTIGVSVLLFQCLRAWQTYFKTKEAKALWFSQALFLSLFSLPFIFGEIAGLSVFAYAISWSGFLVICLLLLINCLFYHLLKAPTLIGRRIMDRIEGFKMYLSKAEKDRFGQLQPENSNLDLYEKFFAYALALDVDQEWSLQFSKEIEKARNNYSEDTLPIWYAGSSRLVNGYQSFTNNSFCDAISSASTAPGSSSGSGGGGSSGGGGGGGGGGGW